MASAEQLSLVSPPFVELVSFTAERRSAAVQLNWCTATIQGIVRFEVERSADGQAFERVGMVPVQRFSTGLSDYRFRDNFLGYSFTHFLYYRLREVGEHGAYSYSPVQVVVLRQPGTLVPYPNPAHGAVTVAGAQATARVELLDALGHRVAVGWAAADGRARITLPDGLAAGMYAVRSGSQVQRLMVE